MLQQYMQQLVIVTLPHSNNTLFKFGPTNIQYSLWNVKTRTQNLTSLPFPLMHAIVTKYIIASTVFLQLDTTLEQLPPLEQQLHNVHVLRLVSMADSRTERVGVLLPASIRPSCIACMYLIQLSLLSTCFPMKQMMPKQQPPLIRGCTKTNSEIKQPRCLIEEIWYVKLLQYTTDASCAQKCPQHFNILLTFILQACVETGSQLASFPGSRVWARAWE